MENRPAWQQNQSPVSNKIAGITAQQEADTMASSFRNPVADFTFTDSDNPFFSLKGTSQGFPFSFIEKGAKIAAEEKTLLISSLRDGNELPAEIPNKDLVMTVLFLSVILFTLGSISSGSFMPAIRFFFPRKLKDTTKKDSRELFTWPSTIFNFATFMILGLFCYSAAAAYGVIPASMKGVIFWLLAVAAIIVALSLRHLLCNITGILSSHRDEFSEYLFVIYYSYRFSASLIAIIIVLMNYTVLLPPESFIIPGVAIFVLMYIIRLIRLILIFLNKSLSIFYLILYLCALEFLPVVVTLKYFTGLV